MKKIKKIPKNNLLVYSLIFLIFFLSVFAFAKISQARSLNYLKQEINSRASSFGGAYSAIIYKPGMVDLEFCHRPNQKIIAASLIKLPILAVALRAVSKKHIGFNQEITIKYSDVAGGSGIFKRIDLPYTLTFRELLGFMIVVSDNTATNKVIDLLGIDYINKTFLKLGLKDTSLKRKMMDFISRKKGLENYTSSRDIISIFKRIYYNRLFSRRLSFFAKNLLLRQQYNDRIVRFLPESVRVAHKTGLEKGVVHDAGIVYGQKENFIICVLTDGVKNYGKAKKFIANISRLAYNRFN